MTTNVKFPRAGGPATLLFDVGCWEIVVRVISCTAAAEEFAGGLVCLL